MRAMWVACVLLGLSSTIAAAEKLPGSLTVHGTNDIRSAWLSQPTDRYQHGVFGKAVEAGGLTIITQDGVELTLTLPETAVFEDREPRLVDLNGDGRDEIILVKSTLDKGAALVIAGVQNGQLNILAEGAPIGYAHRWLNPVGTGDFDGDGQIELAYVETPHIGGTLRILRWTGDKLVEVYAQPGFSNHKYGTRELGLSGVLDTNQDGIKDLIVPDAARRTLRMVTFANGVFKDLRTIALPVPLQKLYTKPNALILTLSNGETKNVRIQ